MHIVKSIMTGWLLVLGFSFSSATTAHAQSSWQDYYGGVVVGYGWYGPIIVNYPLQGYTYWPYYQQPRYSTYAAISYSRSTDHYGLAWGDYTRSEAIHEANGYCDAKDCKPVVWVQGGCAAISAGEKGKGMGWAYHSDKLTAEQYAHLACKRGTRGANPPVLCKQRAWVCSF